MCFATIIILAINPTFYCPPPHFGGRPFPQADSPPRRRGGAVAQAQCAPGGHVTRVSWALAEVAGAGLGCPWPLAGARWPPWPPSWTSTRIPCTAPPLCSRAAPAWASRTPVGARRCPRSPLPMLAPGCSAALRLQPGPGHVVSPPSAQGRSRPGVRPSGGLLPPGVPLRGLQCAGSPATGFPAGKGRQGGSSLAGGGLRSGGCQAEGNASSKKVYHCVCGVTFSRDLFFHHLLCEMFWRKGHSIPDEAQGWCRAS